MSSFKRIRKSYLVSGVVLAAMGGVAAQANSQAGKDAPKKPATPIVSKSDPKTEKPAQQAFYDAVAAFRAKANLADVRGLDVLAKELAGEKGDKQVTPEAADHMQSLAEKAARMAQAVKAIGEAETSAGEMEAAFKAIPKPSDEVAKEHRLVNETLAGLRVNRTEAQSALAKFPAEVDKYATAAAATLQSLLRRRDDFPASGKDAPTEPLLKSLANDIPALAILQGTFPEFQKTLPAKDAEAKNPWTQKVGEVATLLASIDREKHTSVRDQFGELETRLKERRQGIYAKAKQIAASPETEVAAAMALIDSQTDLGKLLSGLNANWATYAGEFKGPDAEKVKEVVAAAMALQKAEVEHAIAVAEVSQALKGNANRQVAKMLPLYYYRDVQRLMYLLRPEATVKDFGVLKDLTASRTDLSDNSFDLEDAVAKLGQAQFRLRQLVIDGAEAKKAAEKAQTAVERKTREVERSKIQVAQLTGRENLRQTELEQADANLKAAQQAQTANQDPAKAADLAKAVADAVQKKQAAERAKTLATNAVTLANQRQTSSQLELDALQEKATEAEEKQSGIETDKKSAQDEIEQFAQDAAKARKSGSRLTIEDSAAFAFNRDNQPITVATGDASDPDPVKRVTLAGFRDSSALFIRGRIDDVARVENIVAGYDRPAPQAKLTLWTMQMDIVGKPRNINAADAQIQRVGQRLSTLRNATEQLGSLIRQRVNQRVNEIVTDERAGYNEFASYDSVLGPENGDRLARFRFYDSKILTGLGYTDHADLKNNPERARFLLRNIPDPGATTTLGETLLVLCMAGKKDREIIIGRFMGDAGPFLETWFRNHPELFESTFVATAPSDVSEKLAELNRKIVGRQRLSRPELQLLARTVFARTLRALWVDGRGELSEREIPVYGDGLAPFQTEIVGALQRNIVWNIAHEMHEKQLAIDANSFDAAICEGFKRQLCVRYAFLGKAFNLDVPALTPIFQSPTRFQRFTLQYPLSGVNARIAAADDRLKKVIGAIEDDVDAAVIEPGVYDILRELGKAALNVGILQRTSMLSTNRMVSRVDAGATAQLAASEKVDILTATQQLTALAIQSGSKNIPGIINSLKSDPNEPPQELYGVTSGGEFKVTPVFDPSGQALRFTFDYVLANRVRDPNGTTSPQLPRVERHTVNLEAQLSTFELREFSRFSANTQLGSPVHRWGGVPLLNEIPLLKEIPLIGYFVRKGGRAAVIQENVILGQTTIYPTILDMVKLLTPISSEAPLGGG